MFFRKMMWFNSFFPTLVAALCAPGAARACSVCFGDPSSGQTQGMNGAIFTLLGFVGLVFLGLGGLAYRLHRRASEANTPAGETDPSLMEGILS